MKPFLSQLWKALLIGIFGAWAMNRLGIPLALQFAIVLLMAYVLVYVVRLWGPKR